MNLKSYLRGAGLALMVGALVLSFSGGTRAAMTDDEIRSRARELGMTEKSEVLLSIPETEAPEPEALKAEAPAAEAQAAEAPKTETPKAEAPETEAPETEVSKTEAPKTEAPETEVPATEAPKTEAPKTEASKTEVSKPETAESGTALEESSEAGGAKTPAEGSSKEPTEAAAALDKLKEETKDGAERLGSDVTGEDKKKSELLADASETAAESGADPIKTGNGFASIHVNSGSSSTTVAFALEKARAVDNAAAFDAYLCSKGYDRHLATGDFRIPAGSSYEDVALILMRRK